MKQIVLAGMLLTATISASATTFYEQLCAFNFNWKKYSMIAPQGDSRTFKTDADYVQAHLSCVVPILKSNPTDALSANQMSTRLHLIELLDGYREAKLFPLNHYRTERIPVFIDEHGTHCAVGYLMMKSGYEELAQRISRTDNYVWVKDIKDEEALVWQQESGFTMEELKLIQGAYDYYPPYAWTSPDKYETPQMPICTTAYFDEVHNGVVTLRKEERVWCKGEGNGKVINGKWEQNYAPGKPWIKGYFINGQRSGEWEEYYPGTTTLCRTESWRRNKLNGVRKRFDRESRLVEEITFVEGAAVCKVNYSLYDSLTYIRIPIDSATVRTQVLNKEGNLIACGVERIYNPSGLLWFQNIELTALNSMQVSSRATQLATGTATNTNFGHDGGYSLGGSSQSISLQSLFGGAPAQPSLVEYHKIGMWWYYPERTSLFAKQHPGNHWKERYQHYGNELYNATYIFNDIHKNAQYDSIHAIYDDNTLTSFQGFSKTQPTHYVFDYYSKDDIIAQNPYIVYLYNGMDNWLPRGQMKKSAGQYNEKGERIGVWYHYNTGGELEKKEEYLIPYKEEEVAQVKKESTASK